jgi:hypothetical protein
MKITRCVICKSEKKVIGFQKDDPILECGHLLTVRDQELDEISQVISEIGEDLIKEYMNAGFDRKTADRFALADMYGINSLK